MDQKIVRRSLDVRQDTSEQRFYFHMAGDFQDAQLTYELHTDREPSVVEFTSMHIPETLESTDLAHRMTLRGIKFANKNGFKVRPKCPYVNGWMSTHPEWQFLRTR